MVKLSEIESKVFTEEIQLQDISISKTTTCLEECIIVVGSTGSGKSSTISKCTGLPIKSGDGHRSITKFSSVYEGQDLQGKSIYWVDTVGWDDLDGDDVETFQDILKFINRYNIRLVRAIVWNVHPGSIRQDATLHKQAHLINQFADKRIWNNVVIICKQAIKAEKEGAGALRAAYDFNKTSKVQIKGYRYIDDPAFDDSDLSQFLQDEAIKKKFNIVDDIDVRNIVYGTIEKLGAPIQIIFNNFHCTACGEEGDNRLMSQYCHMEKKMEHSEELMRYHPAETELFHPTTNRIFDHNGTLKSNWYHSNKFCCVFGGGKGLKTYTCCKQPPEEHGCVERWACCKMDLKRVGCKRRYTCCRVDIDDDKHEGCEFRYKCCNKGSKAKGCKPVCRKCGNPWGSNAMNCYKTSHTLVEIL
ncbi:uncharacterized protein [Lepeophtheirus salmonis]|uniref:AIG1-type G domain-containing protein n=1 Tax=Lepeophtheirus salmonis TaxID=72036 RepID=A0A0K2U019_LEPSM|nr:uncharacterized protein LOC121118888 [Lepeophtheirus salmonis]XP_040569416.1 uncharacterized protein LOC121118888 [Lepeophtheirus salmonis]